MCDGQTDRWMDRILIARPRLHSMQRVKNQIPVSQLQVLSCRHYRMQTLSCYCGCSSLSLLLFFFLFHFTTKICTCFFYGNKRIQLFWNFNTMFGMVSVHLSTIFLEICLSYEKSLKVKNCSLTCLSGRDVKQHCCKCVHISHTLQCYTQPSLAVCCPAVCYVL